MMANRQKYDELRNLLGSMEEGTITKTGVVRIDNLVRGNPELLELYVKYTQQMADLWFGPADHRIDAVLSQLFSGDDAVRECGHVFQFPVETQNISSFPPITETDLGVGIPSTSLSGPFSYFFSGWPMAYMISAVLVGIGLLVGSLVYVSRPGTVDNGQQSALSKSPTPIPNPISFVGRVTGMLDCEFFDQSTTTFTGAYVPLGRKYVLSSGLMEISYDRGAKVILQGPCDYEVTSSAAGFLSVGKLTARIEKKGKGGVKVESADNQKSEIIDQKSLTPVPCPLFSVQTPTAMVTDLGTVFGVEVEKNGNTRSCVFRGSVEMRAITAEKNGKRVVLGENESGYVDKKDGHSNVVLKPRDATMDSFVRQMPPAKKASPLRVVGYFRLGEDDSDAVAHEAACEISVRHDGYMDLEKSGSPRYSNDVAAPNSKLAVHFDGSGWYMGPYILSVETDNFGVEAWVKPDNDKSFVTGIVSNGDHSWSLLQRGDTLCGYVMCDGDNFAPKPGQRHAGDIGAFKFTPGQWYHIALVRDRGIATFYVNGKAVGTSTQEPWTPQGRFWIGGYNGLPTHRFHGSVDEVRVFEFKPGTFRVDDLLLPAVHKESSK